MRLADTAELEQSSTVANSLMNRERNLSGANSYAKELGFDVLGYLLERLQQHNQVAWLDLCCGSAKALSQAARQLSANSQARAFSIVGIDLVAAPEWQSHPGENLELLETSISTWDTTQTFDLITCVHGMHYIGDKLEAIRKACGWLTDEGLFVTHLDLDNLKFEGGKSAGRSMVAQFRRQGLVYDAKRRSLTCRGRRELHFGHAYLGANPHAGPNYTGQAAVDSYYCRV